MKVSLALLMFTLCGHIYCTNGAPSHLEQPVRYDGDQFWKVPLTNLSASVVAGIEKIGGRQKKTGDI